MKPSDYIRKYKKFKDVHSLENLLMVYRNSELREWAATFRDMEAMKLPEVRAKKKEIEREIALAERMLAGWRKAPK